MAKKIRCDVDGNDWVKAKVSDGGDLVFIQMAFRGSFSNVMLSTVNAQKLRKQIKKALEAIEDDGGEAVSPKEDPKTEDPCAPDWFQVGAIVEITGNTMDHGFPIGAKVKVIGAQECEYLDGSDWWYVPPRDCKPA